MESRDILDVHFTDPEATLRLCVSFLLMAPMGEPMHRLLLECVPVSRFCFCFLRLHMPLTRACQTLFLGKCFG